MITESNLKDILDIIYIIKNRFLIFYSNHNIIKFSLIQEIGFLSFKSSPSQIHKTNQNLYSYLNI